MYLLKKNLHISGPTWFKPMLFKGQLYILILFPPFMWRNWDTEVKWPGPAHTKQAVKPWFKLRSLDLSLNSKPPAFLASQHILAEFRGSWRENLGFGNWAKDLGNTQNAIEKQTWRNRNEKSGKLENIMRGSVKSVWELWRRDQSKGRKGNIRRVNRLELTERTWVFLLRK